MAVLGRIVEGAAASVVATVGITVAAWVTEKVIDRVFYKPPGKLDMSWHPVFSNATPAAADPCADEMQRTISVFVERFKAAAVHGERAMPYKDMVCSMCSDLADLLPRLEGDVQSKTKKLVDFVDNNVKNDTEYDIVAEVLYKQVIGGLDGVEQAVA